MFAVDWVGGGMKSNMMICHVCRSFKLQFFNQLLVFECGTFKDNWNKSKTDKNNTHHKYIFNLWIPVTLQYGYAVCCGCQSLIPYLIWKHHRFNCHLRHITIFPPDRIWILSRKTNRLMLYLWQQKISKTEIRIWQWLFDPDERLKHIEILSGKENLIVD